MVVPPEKVLLSMTRHLSRRPSLHEVSRNPSPVSFSYLLQTQQEQPVLLLRPRNTSLALAAVARSVNDVVGGIAGVGVGVLKRQLVVLGEIVHASTLPEGVSLLGDQSHAEEHDAVFCRGGATAGGLRACARVVAVVPALRARARHLRSVDDAVRVLVVGVGLRQFGKACKERERRSD